MTSPAERALNRLRDPDDKWINELSELTSSHLLQTPIRDIIDTPWVTQTILDTVDELTTSKDTKKWVLNELNKRSDAVSDDKRPLAELVPAELVGIAERLLQVEWSPNPEFTFRLLDQPAMRQLVKEVLEDTLVRFQKKLRSMESQTLKNIGSKASQLGARAARRGKGLFGGVAQNISGITENIVGAVTEEVEHVFQDRIRDYLRTATIEAIRSIANRLSDPNHTETMGELRIGMLQTLLDSKVSELASGSVKLSSEDLYDLIMDSVKEERKKSNSAERVASLIDGVFNLIEQESLDEWLTELSLRDQWHQILSQLLNQRLSALFQASEFESWWYKLLDE